MQMSCSHILKSPENEVICVSFVGVLHVQYLLFTFGQLAKADLK